MEGGLALLAHERYEEILKLLEKDGSVKVSMLTKLFNVSIETIRRDLEHLEKQNHLKRVYGGAVLEKINKKQFNFETREKEYIEEKREITNTAVKFITEGQSIAMDASTTNLEVAKILKTKFKKLTILTNSLAIANELADMEYYTIILTGGIFIKDEFSLVGDIAEKNISDFYIDTAFISISGVSLHAGLTEYSFDGIQIQKKMIEVSKQVIVLADNSKFDVVCLQKVADLDKVDMIITDSKLKKCVLDKYLNKGIKIIN